MKVYRIYSSSWYALGQAILWGVIGLGFTIAAVSQGVQVVTLLLLPVGFVAFVMAYRFFIRETEEIQILDDGIVVFSKVVLETRVAALDITGVYRAKRWLNQEDEPRAVRIEHKLGNVRLARFNEIEEFIEDLRRLNPLVEVEQGL